MLFPIPALPAFDALVGQENIGRTPCKLQPVGPTFKEAP